jgi:hypothetical protein
MRVAAFAPKPRLFRRTVRHPQPAPRLPEQIKEGCHGMIRTGAPAVHALAQLPGRVTAAHCPLSGRTLHEAGADVGAERPGNVPPGIRLL